MGNEKRQETYFFNKNKKNREKTGKKGEKNTPKNWKKLKITRNTETRFWEMLKTETRFRRDFGKC